MHIGIDISALQSNHKMRGIGTVARNIIRNLDGSAHTYTLYVKSTAEEDIAPLRSEITLASKHYSFIATSDEIANIKQLPGLFRFVSKVHRKLASLREYRVGSRRFSGSDQLDAFIQLDQSEPLARVRHGKSNTFIAYDLIPIILEGDYLPGYKLSRKKGLSLRSCLKNSINKYTYILRIKGNVKKSTSIMAISETTRADFISLAGAHPNSITTVDLGVEPKATTSSGATGLVSRFVSSSWGYIEEPDTLEGKDFLLFVGGVDPRRKLEDLVSAFNNLRAQGVDIKLVLTGDIMKGPNTIPTLSIQRALASSSYINDIYFLGYVSQSTRDWLYGNATAFVFPSVYEGFGLPVLEVMIQNTPVIAYPAGAVKEVAKKYITYAEDDLSLIDAVYATLSMDPDLAKKQRTEARKHALTYTWEKTTSELIAIATSR